MRRTAAVVLVLNALAVAVAPAQDTPEPARRRPVTAAHLRTAFADERARTLLERARAARLAQDSALSGYDARTYLRLTVGIAARAFGPEKLLFRAEESSRVRWARNAAVWVQPTGRRAVFPGGHVSGDMTDAAPIPYFPGRESLWIPSGKMGVVHADVDEADIIHPLAAGAEAYYRYATGDSMSLRLPDGTIVRLRELRITSREATWHAMVGSFWFDVDRGSLVRAAYRLSADLDLWQLADEEDRRELEEALERARTDTGAVAAAARRRAENAAMSPSERLARAVAQGTFRPARARLSAVTVEYQLVEGRFWLPRVNSAEGEVEVGFLRLPIRWQERFNYDAVNGAEPLPAVPVAAAGEDSVDAEGEFSATVGPAGARPDTAAAAQRVREDSIVAYRRHRADSLTTVADSASAAGDTIQGNALRARARRNTAIANRILRRRESCAADSTWFYGTTSRYNGALKVAVRMPCDTATLSHSPDLPGSIYDAGDELFSESDRDALLESLGISLQPGWTPSPKPKVVTGLAFVRYNRIESLSLGMSALWSLGAGYTAELVPRVSLGDRTVNGELTLARSNGRTDLRFAAYRRLAVANDDWGDPLSFGASVANALYARDEGFYYRAWGAELAGTRDASATVGSARMRWRLFVERQGTAGAEPNTTESLFNLAGNPRFNANIDALPLTVAGGAAELVRTFGTDPTRLQLVSRLRGEGAFTEGDSSGSSGYGRLFAEGTLSRELGRRFAASLTAGAGSSVGELPVQRQFFLGGLQTVRGQYAYPAGTGRVGDAFWLARAELGHGGAGFRPVVYYDVGWAGPRADMFQSGRPLSGAGLGLSVLRGLFRFDVSRGIWPEQRWRGDVSIGARF